MEDIGFARCRRDGIKIFDALFVANGAMAFELIKREFLLATGEYRRNWVHRGVHVTATRSISQRGLVKYEFTGPSWKMLFDLRLDAAGHVMARRSRITWVADSGVQRRDRGERARVELNEFLLAALSGDETP